MYIIYKTTNLINNKIYIGQHRTENANDKYLGSGKIIRLAIKKYGRENFTRQILAITYDAEEAHQLQVKFIKQHNCRSKFIGYNISIGGFAFKPGCRKSYVGVNNVFYGKIHSEETKQKIRNTIQRLYNSRKGSYNGMFNKKHSEQSKKKMSQNSKGMLCGDQNPSKRPSVKEKISKANMGIKNGNALVWTLIFPDGSQIQILGGIKRELPKYELTLSHFSKKDNTLVSRKGHILLKKSKDGVIII